MDYTNILKFKYTWRNYQARVLANANEYIKDNRVHIVAAPGSGKTTLGIELIARCKEVALVLAPSITMCRGLYLSGFKRSTCDYDLYVSGTSQCNDPL